jgi:hypothetical protein
MTERDAMPIEVYSEIGLTQRWWKYLLVWNVIGISNEKSLARK